MLKVRLAWWNVNSCELKQYDDSYVTSNLLSYKFFCDTCINDKGKRFDLERKTNTLYYLIGIQFPEQKQVTTGRIKALLSINELTDFTVTLLDQQWF